MLVDTCTMLYQQLGELHVPKPLLSPCSRVRPIQHLQQVCLSFRDNFPDIFFGDATFPSSLFNLDDVKPFGEPFGKDNALVDFEKNILVSDTIERSTARQTFKQISTG